MWTKDTAKVHLRKNWSNPSSDIAFQGARKLHKYYGGKITFSEILEILKTFESYSIMRIEHSSKNRKYQGFNFPVSLWNIAEVIAIVMIINSIGHFLIFSREVLILTLSILLTLQGCSY